jgi:trehalose 2-sulfotransferase
MRPVIPGSWADAERRYKEALRSPTFDVGNGTPTRLRYLILSTQRTGSELLCAYLRERGIGVPLEYFGPASLAERLGCLDGNGRTLFQRYVPLLEAKRTTPNGIFGMKLHPGQLEALSEMDDEKAFRFLNLFGKIVVLRRRDKVLQAISLARAIITGQFHNLAGDETRPLRAPDDLLFERIAANVSDTLREERYAGTLLARIEPSRVYALWYEDFSEAAFDSLAAALCAKAGAPAGDRAPSGEPIPLRKGDSREASEIKERFLAYISGDPTAKGTHTC